MKWKTKKPVPRIGDTRHRFKFAFLPIRINEWSIWLERYQVTEEYQEVWTGDSDSIGGHAVWVETSRRACDYYI